MDSVSFVYGYAFDPYRPQFIDIIRKNFDVEDQYQAWCESVSEQFVKNQEDRPVKRVPFDDMWDFEAFLESDFINPYQLIKTMPHQGPYKWKTHIMMIGNRLNYLHGVEIHVKASDVNQIINYLPINTLLNTIPTKMTTDVEAWYSSLEGHTYGTLPRIWGVYKRL